MTAYVDCEAMRQHYSNTAQGYELTEEECNLSLDEFRDLCGDANGSPKYAQPTALFSQWA